MENRLPHGRTEETVNGVTLILQRTVAAISPRDSGGDYEKGTLQ